MNSRLQLIAVVKVHKKKAFNLLSACAYTSITSLFLQIVHNGLCHAALSEFFQLRLTQSNLFLEGFYRCPFTPSSYHSLEYSLPLPSCTFYQSTALLEISCSQVSY